MPSVVLQARWLLPIDGGPIPGGWVEVAGGRIVRIGRPPAPLSAGDLGDVALLPGLVNAHTHIELSGLHGRVGPSASLVDWIRALLAARPRQSVESASSLASMRSAVEDLRQTGTVLVGDVTNSLAGVAAVRTGGLNAVVFHEVLGFNLSRPAPLVSEAWTRAEAAVAAAPPGGTLGLSVVAHAPYSVSPALFLEIARRSRQSPLAVHVAESAEEVEFLRTGRGPFRELLVELGVWTDRWQAPGCDPVEYLQRVGYLQPGMLAVHGVHLPDHALERLRDAGGVLVTCPRSNTWVGGGLPRVSRFYAAGLPVAVGTDSLASVPTLNLFDELAELRRIAPDVSAASLLESATRVGAEALGFGRTFGTLAAGKRAAMVAVDVPAGVADVEEFLVSGVPPSSVRPVSA